MKAVFFDVGETLFDETRLWTREAERIGVSPLVLFAALGALIERRSDHHEIWNLVDASPPPSLSTVTSSDLYPDALPCLDGLAGAGYLVGLAGNQPEGAAEVLRGMGLPASIIASSALWGVEKPSAAFFERIAEAAGFPSSEIAYVGDRLDNDVLPAKAAGMFTIFVRRGPWGYLHAQRPEVSAADASVRSLLEILPILNSHR